MCGVRVLLLARMTHLRSPLFATARVNITLRVSFDDGKTWPVSHLLEFVADSPTLPLK